MAHDFVVMHQDLHVTLMPAYWMEVVKEVLEDWCARDSSDSMTADLLVVQGFKLSNVKRLTAEIPVADDSPQSASSSLCPWVLHQSSFVNTGPGYILFLCCCRLSPW